MLPMSVTVTAINMPPGTISLRWDDGRELNYPIPVDFAGASNRAYTREEFLDWLVALQYEFKEELAAYEQMRAEGAFAQTGAQFQLDEVIDLTARGESFRAARELTGSPQNGPRPR